MKSGKNPPVGLILCTEKGAAEAGGGFGIIFGDASDDLVEIVLSPS